VLTTLRPEAFPDHLYYDLYARFAALWTGYQLGFFDSSANYPGCRRRRSATGLPSSHVGNFPSRETGSRNGSLRYGSDSGSHTWAYPGGWLTDDYSWRWVFYINIPVGIAAILMC